MMHFTEDISKAFVLFSALTQIGLRGTDPVEGKSKTYGMTEPRRLRGHRATATCCIASRDRPGVVATAAEDGCVCWFDMRCKDVLFVIDVGNNTPISSLCFKAGSEDKVYVSFGNEIKCLDVHMASSSWKPLETYNYNKDEINQIACHSKSSFLAAADDGGDVKIIDIRQHCPYKTLRSGHSSICSAVQFLPWKPWEVITGGLDSKLVMWDFSKGRPQKTVDFGGASDASDGGHMGQCLNPAFVHTLAVPEIDMVDKLGKICVVGRGDGVVDIINVESELATNKSKSLIKPKKGTKLMLASSVASQVHPTGRNLHLDHSLGGHTAAVSCVSLSMFGEKGKFIISGGNDKSIKVWDWSKSSYASQSSSNSDILSSNFNLNRKVNWLCTTPTDRENLIVCDTSRVIKVYTIM